MPPTSCVVSRNRLPEKLHPGRSNWGPRSTAFCLRGPLPTDWSVRTPEVWGDPLAAQILKGTSLQSVDHLWTFGSWAIPGRLGAYKDRSVGPSFEALEAL